MNTSRVAYLGSLVLHIVLIGGYWSSHWTAGSASLVSRSKTEAYFVSRLNNKVSVGIVEGAASVVAHEEIQKPSFSEVRTEQKLNVVNFIPSSFSEARLTQSASFLQAGDIFYTRDQLQLAAEVLSKEAFVNLEWEPDLRGKITLELFISRYGAVVDVHILSSELAPLLVEQLKEQFRNTFFTPAIRDERPVNSIQLLELRIQSQHEQSLDKISGY